MEGCVLSPMTGTHVAIVNATASLQYQQMRVPQVGTSGEESLNTLLDGGKLVHDQ